ncbi:MAG: flagellar assembly protein FliH [Polyangiaceae bacterium]|nr:flagellar assembly protein FliH [Polyangiaceae bacterium]
MPDAPRRAKFAQVTGNGGVRKQPSWLPSSQKAHQAPLQPRLESPSLKPPPLPSEFVEAVRQELGEMPPQRPSMRPSAGGPLRAPTLPPPAFATAEPSPIAAPVQVPVPVVDPELCHAFEEAVELLALERQRVFEQTASQLAELAAVIARRVIAREISLRPELVVGLVREGLEALGKHDRVLIRLGAGFEGQRDMLEQRLTDRGSRAEVRIEPQLPEHACLVETDLGQVDESVETRLATLLHALRPDSASQ